MELFNSEDFIWFLVRHREVLKNRAEPIPSLFFDFLRMALEELSFAYKALDPGKTLLPANGKPGYLMTRCGNWHVFVPWPLVVTFPGPVVLEVLLRVGKNVSIAPAKNLCISGSSAWLGEEVVIGDIDYCQYVDCSPALAIAAAEPLKNPEKDRVLIRASYGDKDETVAQPPWSGSWPNLSASMVADSLNNAQRLMLDFVGVAESMGLMPISCVVLACDFNDRSVGAAKRSFVFQEAIAFLNDPAEPPWSLVDPINSESICSTCAKKPMNSLGKRRLKR
jgi:hypothetical protein